MVVARNIKQLAQQSVDKLNLLAFGFSLSISSFVQLTAVATENRCHDFIDFFIGPIIYIVNRIRCNEIQEASKKNGDAYTTVAR